MILSHLPDTWTTKEIEQRVYIYDDTGKPRCGARNRTNQKPCMSSPMKGSARCRKHGGNNASGENHPAYKTGRYIGRYAVPENLIGHYEKSINDPNLMDLRDNVSLIDVRLQDLLKRLESADFGAAVFPELTRLYYRADRHLRTRNMEDFIEIWGSFGDLIRQGNADFLTWKEVLNVNEQRGKMTKRIMDIETSAHRAVSLNELMYYMRQIYLAFIDSNGEETPEEREAVFGSRIRQLLNDGTPE